MKTQTALTILLVTVACDAAPVAPDNAPTKDEVRDQVQKGDSLTDWCAILDWYGDGICDPFCLDPDPDCEVKGECRATGCGGHVCADRDVITTCEAQLGQECFDLAMCERQDDGECGWTQTEESQACFDDAFGVNDDDAWLALRPTQCGTNPWDEFGDGPEIKAILDHYNGNGIVFEQIGLLNPNEPIAVCHACQCPRGDLLVVHATGENVKAAKEAGFEEVDALAHETVQCGGNPWEALEIHAPEQVKLERWTSQMDAFADVGFVQPVEPVAVCLACQCPRGDLAVAVPGGDDDARTLLDNGFSVLE